jgi:hypothetical protein
MENLNELYCGISLELFSQVFSIITGVIAIVAVTLAFGYLFRPSIKFTVWTKESIDEKDKKLKKRICVRLFNVNISKRTLTDIQCQIIAYKKPEGNKVRSLILKKDRIISLKWNKESKDEPNYVFYNTWDEKLKDYNYVKIKFLIPNFLGIKKAYEFEMSLDKINQNESNPIKPKKS